MPGEIADGDLAQCHTAGITCTGTWMSQPGCTFPGSSLLLYKTVVSIALGLHSCTSAPGLSHQPPLSRWESKCGGHSPAATLMCRAQGSPAFWARGTPVAQCPCPAAPCSLLKPCCHGRSSSWAGHHGGDHGWFKGGV